MRMYNMTDVSIPMTRWTHAQENHSTTCHQSPSLSSTCSLLDNLRPPLPRRATCFFFLFFCLLGFLFASIPAVCTVHVLRGCNQHLRLPNGQCKITSCMYV